MAFPSNRLAIILVAIIAIIKGKWLTNETEGVCTNDPLIHFNATATKTGLLGEKDVHSIDPCIVFSENYKEARSKFREAAIALGAELTSLPIVMDDGNDNENDDNTYTTDIAVLRGTLPGLVIHSSGIHGVEGYAGSAIQISFLKYIMTGTNAKKEYPTMVFIHAVNPWGMSHYRRTNENNVDLNRNGIPEQDWDKNTNKASVLNRDPNYAHYEDFNKDLFNPPHAPSWYDATITTFLRAIQCIVKYGYLPMKRAMVTGQYHYAKGIFFGGTELQTSHKMLLEYFQNTLLPTLDVLTDESANENDSTKSSPRSNNVRKKITWIDVHTGLGKSGVDTLFSPPNVSTDTMQSTFPGALLDHPDVTGGYDMAIGLTRHFYTDVFTVPASSASSDENDKPWIVLEEFGTVPGIMVARALILENMARHYLPPSEQAYWTTYTRSAFYQRTPTWRKRIVTRGLTVLLQSIKRSSS